jgi:hypothetical protein
LDNDPFALRKKGVKLSQVKGYEDISEEQDEYKSGGQVKYKTNDAAIVINDKSDDELTSKRKKALDYFINKKESIKNPKKPSGEVEMMYYPNKEFTDFHITSSKDIYSFAIAHWNKDELNARESFFVAFLNRNNRIMGFKNLFSGGISATVTDIRIILAEALKMLAPAFIIIHNHPSGNTQPSKPDLELTERVKNSAKLMDIQLLDHLIITDEKYYSFADEGLL